MAEKLPNTSGPDELLPVRQRIAWMAAIWTLSAGAMVLVTMAVHALFR